MNQHNISFNQGDVTQYGALQKQVKGEIKTAKCDHKNKVESMLGSGTSHPPKLDMKPVMGLLSKKCTISLNGQMDAELSNDLSSFYNRFNVHDSSEQLAVIRNTVFNEHGFSERHERACTQWQQW